MDRGRVRAAEPTGSWIPSSRNAWVVPSWALAGRARVAAEEGSLRRTAGVPLLHDASCCGLHCVRTAGASGQSTRMRARFVRVGRGAVPRFLLGPGRPGGRVARQGGQAGGHGLQAWVWMRRTVRCTRRTAWREGEAQRLRVVLHEEFAFCAGEANRLGMDVPPCGWGSGRHGGGGSDAGRRAEDRGA